MKSNRLVTFVCLLIAVESHCAPATTNSSVTVNPSSSPKSKTKRGILNYGYGNGLVYSVPHQHAHGFAVGLPKPWITTPFAKYPGIYRNVIPGPSIVQPAVPNFVLSPGDAAITSYNVNFPRHPIVAQRPFFFGPPALPKPLLPTPSFVIPQRPIIPVAVPAFTNQFPVIAKPIPTPTYTIIPGGPSILPTGHVHPQFIPIHLPHQPPTVSTIPATTIPLPGTTIITNTHLPPPVSSATDPWRPIIVTHQTPAATPITPFQRPPISLLPPFFSSNDRRTAAAQLELQSTYDRDYAQPHQLYQSPSQTSQAELAAAVHQHHLSGQDIFQGKGYHILRVDTRGVKRFYVVQKISVINEERQFYHKL